MESLIQDLKFGLRMLTKNFSFTVLAILTLALGIGTNTALFSLTDQVLFRSLPVKNSSELVILRSPGPLEGRITSDGDRSTSFSYPLYKDIRDRNNVFAGLLARFPISVSLSSNDQTERVDGELVSGNYFEVLGVEPALGRVFTQDDDKTPGAHPVVVLSHKYWTRRFNNDASILNKAMTVNGQVMTVIGVSRAGFSGVQIGQLPDLFVPLNMKAKMTPNWDGLDSYKDSYLSLIGRLKPGLTISQAQTNIEPIYRAILQDSLPKMANWGEETQKRYVEKKILLDPGENGRQILQKDIKQPLYILMGIAGLVLLIACTNVANLLIVRGASRQREIAVRMALGASRMRIVRQFLIENLMLFLLSGVIGLLVAAWSYSILVTMIPASFAALNLSTEFNTRLLVFNLFISITTGLFFGLLPAFRATNLNLETTLREQGLRSSNNISQARFRKVLVVSQIFFTMILLVIAGLFARSLTNLQKLDIGVKADQVIAFSIAPELNGYTPERTQILADNIREAIKTVPGVNGVTGSILSLLSGNNASSNISIEGYQPAPNENIDIYENWIGPDFFATLGIPLLSGREFNQSDTAQSTKVAIINETMAKQFFPNQDPIGKRFGFGAGSNVKADVEIVGVVKDSKHGSVREEKQPFLFIPFTQNKGLGSLTFYLRTSQDLNSLSSTLRNEVARFDSNLPIFDLKSLPQQINESLFTDRTMMFLSICFGLLAATLAAIGLYGVMSYAVTSRTREIGIRLALGATRSNISWLILKEVVLMISLGLIAGLPLSYVISRFAESLLFGVKASDPIVFIGAIILLIAIGLIGGLSPAYRATKVDPMETLRYE